MYPYSLSVGMQLYISDSNQYFTIEKITCDQNYVNLTFSGDCQPVLSLNPYNSVRVKRPNYLDQISKPQSTKLSGLSID